MMKETKTKTDDDYMMESLVAARSKLMVQLEQTRKNKASIFIDEKSLNTVLVGLNDSIDALFRMKAFRLLSGVRPQKTSDQQQDYPDGR